jgi:hypothetical protein
MAVTACCLEVSNVLVNSIHTLSTDQVPNSVYPKCCAFPPYVNTSVICFSLKWELSVLMVCHTICLTLV